MPIDVKSVATATSKQGRLGGRHKISAADLALITRQLATLVQASLPIEESLQAVGAVTLETLDAITRQLVKIDHFAKTSSPEVEEPLEIPLGLTELPRVAEDAVPAQETDEPTRSDVLTDPQEDPEAGVVPAGSPADALARDGEI